MIDTLFGFEERHPSKDLMIRIAIDCQYIQARQKPDIPRLKQPKTEIREKGPRDLKAKMDERVWGSMPEDCMDKILVRVPLPTTFRLRSVCKRWKSFIFSEAYFNLRAQLSPYRHCLLLSTHGHLACVYNFLLEQWHYLPLPRIKLPISIPPLTLLSASQSLLCFGNQVAECSVLFVCNPFIKSLRSLPAMPKIRYIHKLSLTFDHSQGSFYRIVVAGEAEADINCLSNSPRVFKLLTEVYDSRSDRWRTAGSPLPDAKFGSDPGVWCNGSFYCVTEQPYGVVEFTLAALSWREVGSMLPEGLATPSLVECRGRLLMVGRIKHKTAENTQKSDRIAIWELQKTGETEMQIWREIVKMPESLGGEFLQPLHGLTPLVAAGVDNLVCITSHLSARALVFDLTTSVWRWLPQDPLFPNCRSFHLMGFPLEPRMDTLP